MTGEGRSSSAIEHPRYHLALRTRTRLLGTLNFAVAIGGRSSGWGGDGKPRRTFVGHHRASIGGKAPYHRAIEVVLVGRASAAEQWTLLCLPLGSGIASLRRIPGLSNDAGSRT